MHSNNFDFLRITFASFVIITHSYSLTGLSEDDFLHIITDGQTTFSDFGVMGFFSISGYLIALSLLRSKSLKSYYIKRSLRIFPALFINSIFCALIIGTVVTSSSLLSHFSDKTTWLYILQNTFLKSTYHINHIFNDLPYPNTINGSLWTIPYEFFCYCALSVLFFIKNKKNWFRLVLISTFVVLLYIRLFNFDLIKVWVPIIKLNGEYIGHLALFFLGGAILATFKDSLLKYKHYFTFGSVTIILLAFLFGIYGYLQHIALPLLVISFGESSTPIINKAGKYGDFSYGIYLYGFVIQQTLVCFFLPNHIWLTIISISISFVIGALSWHLIEKKALHLKSSYS